MKTVYRIAVVLLTASMAMAQYHTSFTKGTYDLTQNVKNGLNVWKYLPGNPQCQPSSDSMSYGGFLYFCVGTDSYPYSYDRRTKVWTKRTDMGATGMSVLVAKNASIVYALWTSGACNAPDKMLWVWTPSAGWNFPGGTYPAGTQKCLSQVSVGADGFLAGITKGAGQQNVLWESQDNGKTWVQWSTGWSYVSMWNKNEGCGVSSGSGTSGPVYTIGMGGSPGNVGGNFVGCTYGDQPFVMIAWDASGNVSMNDEQTGAWDSVSGLSATHIVGTNKLMVLALDQSNKPFHWNIKARSITATTTGTWNSGCPGPGSQCHPTAQHRSTVWVGFKSGHGLYDHNPANVQTIIWNGAMNNQFFNVNPGCDPLFGLATDVECIDESSGGETCLQSGAGIGGVPQPPDDSNNLSHDYQTALSYFDRIGPQLDFVSPNGLQYWSGDEQLNMADSCLPGTFATCPGPDPHDLFVLSTGAYGNVNVENQLDEAITLANPYISVDSYQIVNGISVCDGNQITWGSYGNFDDNNFVPTCD